MSASRVHHLLEVSVQKKPSKKAVFSREGTLSYGQLAALSQKFSVVLQGSGVKPGDRVMILTGQSLSTVVAVMGCSIAGAVFVLADPEAPAESMRHYILDCRPAVAVVFADDTGTIKSVSGIPLIVMQKGEQNFVPDASAHEICRTDSMSNQFDVAALVYTSGSEAKPKAVVCPHDSMLFATNAIQSVLKLRSDDKIAVFLPFTFDYALYQIFLAFNVSASIGVGSSMDAGPALPFILKAWEATCLPIVPALGATLVAALKKRYKGELSDLRMVTNTAEHLNEGLIKDIQTLLPHCAIYPMYGLTECKRVSILEPSEVRRKSGSVGKPLPETRCLVVDKKSQPLPTDTEGELVVFGANVMRGYWNAPNLTLKRFRKWQDTDEIVLFTGDICKIDQEGYIYFCGRNDDVFKYKGYRLSTLEIETATLSIDKVEQAALVLLSDQTSALFYSGDISVAEINTTLADLVSWYAIPPTIVKVDLFPYLANGKVSKKELRESYINGNLAKL